MTGPGHPVKQHLHKTFLQLGRGFQFSTEPPKSLLDLNNLKSSDPWVVLGCVLARARQGDLRTVEVLPDLMARDDGALVWNGCVQLIGFAGCQTFIFDTAEQFLSKPEDLGVQWYISDMMLNSCSLRAVEPLLKLHGAATDRDARRHIEHCLSTLLEEGSGDIDDGPEEYEVPDPDYPEPFTEYRTVLDREGYIKKVRATAAQVAQNLAFPDQPVAAGKPFDFQALVMRLYDRICSGAESGSKMEWERMCFEAFSGIDCSEFYKGGRIQRLAALAVLEDFLDSGGAARFEIGTRYFFSHPIKC